VEERLARDPLRPFLLISFSLHLLMLAFLVLAPYVGRKPRPRPSVVWVGLLPETKASRVEPKEAKTEVVEEKKPASTQKPEKRAEERKELEAPPSKPKEQPKEPEVAAGGTDAGQEDLGIRVMEGQSFRYSYYLSTVLRKISANWHRAPRSTRGLSAVIYFEIEADGSVSDVRVEEGSSDRDFDLRAERALVLTRKLPPLPRSFEHDRLRVHLEFEGR
jgi:TonB family protein